MRGLGSEVTSGFLPGEVKDHLSQSGAILLEKRQCEILYIKKTYSCTIVLEIILKFMNTLTN
jgi:hypothetical protein